MAESLITQCTWLESEIEETRAELREVASAGDYDGVTRVADRLGDQIQKLARLREKAAALSGRDLAKSVAGHLMRMAKTKPSARALTVEPQREDAQEENDATRFN